jgi:hypothetical protein
MPEKNIYLEPDRITQFQPVLNTSFFLVTTPSLIDSIQLYPSKKYSQHGKLTMNPSESLINFIEKNVPDNSDILLVLPNGYTLGYQNPHSSLPAGSLGNRRMIALRCLSTPATLEDLDRIFKSSYEINIEKQAQLIKHLYTLGEQADYLQITDLKSHEQARFNHLSDNYAWHSLYGTPERGRFTLAPSGETNVIIPKIAEKIEEQIPLDITGTIILHGVPIVHYGVKPNMLDIQTKVFNALNSLRYAPVTATLDTGKITHLTSNNKEAKPAIEALEALFNEDEIYRFVLELGFGLHEGLILCPGNVGTNEFYGGKNGSIHYGLGRVPHTNFHVDIVCPNAQLITNKGEHIFGPQTDALSFDTHHYKNTETLPID